MMRRLLVALALATGLTPLAPAADVEAADVEGNVTLASDYSFRGQSQTGRAFAIQGGFDYAHESGFYVGTWASNVNFGAPDDGSPYTTMELDLYAGFGGSFGESVSWDASIIRFEYPNEGDASDYIEASFSVGFGDLSVGFNYSPEYLGDGGDPFIYPFAGYSLALADGYSLDVSIGQGIIDCEEEGTCGDHMDYSITLGTTISGVDLGISVVGTTIEDAGPGDEARAILSLSKSL